MGYLLLPYFVDIPLVQGWIWLIFFVSTIILREALMSNRQNIIIIFTLLFPIIVHAGEKVDYTHDTMTGNWNGVRDQLYTDGVDITLGDTFDAFGNVSGGIKKGVSVLNQGAATVTLDGNKLVGVNGLTAMVSVIGDAGSPSRSLIGAAERIDDLETYHSGFSLYQAWVQQNWFGGGISLLGGIYDLSNEFYDLNTSDFFLNTGFGIGAEFADTATDGVAIFPTSAPSIRLRVQPSEELYAQAVLSDGINGAPLTSKSYARLNQNSPAVFMVEAGYLPQEGKKELGKFAVGVWSYTGGIHNIFRTGTEQISNNNRGIYAMAEYSIFRHNDNPDRGLKGFLRAGYADSDFARFDFSWSAGIVYNGIFPKRENSQLGFAVSQAHTLDDYRGQTFVNPDINPEVAETAIELSYKDKVLPWLTIQPDMQYIIHPGALGLRDDAFVIGSRLTANF